MGLKREFKRDFLLDIGRSRKNPNDKELITFTVIILYCLNKS
jgi:hypothetical protein